MTFRIIIRSGGFPQGGLSPVWQHLCRASDGTEISAASVPIVADAVIPGVYSFTVAAADGAVYGVIDAGLAVPNMYDRYIFFDSGADLGAELASISSDAKLSRQVLCNARVDSTAPIGDITVYDDNGTTPLATWRRVDNGGTITRTPK